MQISAGQDGIQKLLRAEQEAQKVVADARKSRISSVPLSNTSSADSLLDFGRRKGG